MSVSAEAEDSVEELDEVARVSGGTAFVEAIETASSSWTICTADVDLELVLLEYIKSGDPNNITLCEWCLQRLRVEGVAQVPFAVAWVLDHGRWEGLGTVRTDFSLMKWMYCRRIITEAQFKRTQLLPAQIVLPAGVNRRRHPMTIGELPRAPSASPPASVRAHLRQAVGYQTEPYTMNAGRRQDRRRLDATRTMIRANSYA